MTINENIELYATLQAQKEELESQMSSLKEIIMKEMDEQEQSKVITSSGKVAQIVNKEIIKYTDEVAIINYLESHNMSQFVTKKVNTTSLNKELKKGQSLTESLHSLYTTSNSRSFSVK